jgi:sarcosine oxidase gamma subunit
MPHMTLRTGSLEGVPLRVLRASFSGELGYEINLPSQHVGELLDRLWAYAAQIHAAPYGIEALEILRTEKCFIHIGTDTDGTTLPGDVGLAKAVERKQANFVGRRSLSRASARDPNRFQLVALKAADGRTRLPVGGQIALAPPPARTEGYVTSSYMSPELAAPVALGMLSRGFERLGERVPVHHMGSIIEAVVAKGPFIDPQGERLRGAEGAAAGSGTCPSKPPGRDRGMPQVPGVEIAGLSVELVREWCIGSLRHFDAAGSVEAHLRELLGGPMPQPLKAVRYSVRSSAQEIVLAWRSPTEILLMSMDGAAFAAIVAQAEEASPTAGCMVAQTGGLWVWRVTGALTRDLLLRLGSIASIPGPGEARASRIAELPVLALCVEEGQILLVVERVYSEHLLGWIRDTAADF